LKLATPCGIVSLLLTLAGCTTTPTPPPAPDCDASLCVSQASYDCQEATGTMSVTVSRADGNEADTSYKVGTSINNGATSAYRDDLLTSGNSSRDESVGPAKVAALIVQSEATQFTRTFEFARDCTK